MRLPIKIYGAAVLRKRAEEVKEITDDIRTFVADLIETCQYKHRGVGLAAPQVGKSIRIFVVCHAEYDENENLQYLEPEVYINPKILDYSKDTWFMDEGCLSIPGILVPVERPVSIVIEAMNVQGKIFRQELSEYKARVILHENDHLNGVLSVDRTPSKERKKIENYLKKMKKESTS